MSERLRRLKMRLPGRTPEPGSWTVCSTVAEPPELLYAFVAHYLELGAAEIHLFIDDPDQLGLEILAAMPKVTLTICDDSYWKKLTGARPDRHVRRQLRNANLAYEKCRTAWFFFCDADEFFVSKRPVSKILKGQGADVTHCRTFMAERIFPAAHEQKHLFEGALRVTVDEGAPMLHAVYGDLAAMTTRGLTGHVMGKSFVRTRRTDLRIRLHFPVPYDAAEEERQKKAGTQKRGHMIKGAWLVHYDGMTPLHWMLKLLRYYLTYAPTLEAGDEKVFERRTPARSLQLNTIYEAQGDPEVLAQLRPLIQPDAQMLAQLKQANGLLEWDLDPGDTARRLILPDLSFAPADFDAHLKAQHGDLIAQYRLEG